MGKSEYQLSKDDGHRLLGPFNRARSDEKSKTIILQAELDIKNLWKEKLRKDREDYSAETYGMLDHEIPSNEDIGRELECYSLSAAVEWRDPLHSENGGAFRYFQTGLYRIPTAGKCFGRETPIVPLTLNWGCASILNNLKEKLRAK